MLQRDKISIFNIWPFHLSLALLVVNDWILKTAYPGVLTGKISDFSGIFLVGLILFALFPNKRALVTVLISMAFAYWKSPFSQTAIDTFNSLNIIPYERVVDYTDLFALLMLPLADIAVRKRCDYTLPILSSRHLKIPSILLATFAITATSMPLPPRDAYTIKTVNEDDSIDVDKASELIEAIAKKRNLKCKTKKDNALCNRCSRDYNTVTLEFCFNDKHNEIKFNVAGAHPPGMFFDGPVVSDMNLIKRDLKYYMAREFNNTEFIQGHGYIVVNTVAPEPISPPTTQSLERKTGQTPSPSE